MRQLFKQLVAVACFALTAASQGPGAGGAGEDSAATVYVYRYWQFTGSALSPSVYCDEAQLARMENGRYFGVRLEAGRHLFRSNDKQAGVELEVRPGQRYYLRVELVPGLLKGHGRVMLVPAEQASYEIRKLKPLDAGKAVDKRVAVEPFE